MGKLNNKPTNTVMRKASQAVSNNMRADNDKTIQSYITKQQQVDFWNTKVVGKTDRHGNSLDYLLNGLQLDNHSLVVQLYMENPIKQVITNADGEIMIVPGISQIDGRKRNTDAPVWIDTPFPVVNKGIIVAISPWLQLHYLDLKEKMSKYGVDVVIPEVGDMVMCNHFMYKDTRFYPDKQKQTEDFVRTQEEFRLGEFSFMFKISNYDIESVIKKDSDLYNRNVHVSPLANLMFSGENDGKSKEESSS